MKRREFLFGGAVGLSALSLRPGLALPQTSADARLNQLLDRIFHESMLVSPESATALGLDKGVRIALKSRLDDRSPAGRAAGLAFYREKAAALAGIDEAGLSQAGRRNLGIARHMLDEQLTPAKFGLRSVQSPYVISQLDGVYFYVPDMLDSQHVIESADDAEAYLTRLSSLRFALDEESAYQREQAAVGNAAPAWALQLALGQMRALRAAAPGDSSMARSLARRAGEKGLPGDWNERAARIVAGEVYPALDRQIALVEGLVARTRPGDGVWRLRDGEAIYAAALAQATTTRMTPDEVHATGLEQVAELTARLKEVLDAAGYTRGSIGERLAALNASPDQAWPNTDEGRAGLLASLNAGVAEMRAKLPRAFSRLLAEPLEIRRVPPEIQDGAPNGYYYPAAVDGSRPAIYWINLKQTGDWPKYQLPSLTYHEGVPGHHLQNGYARLDGGLPMLLQNYYISAYGEGWALYSEQLADELGAYSGIEKAGYLQSFLFRAARLVVDTGIHHKRWSREKALAWFLDTVGQTRERGQREINRYCTMVGQACSYKIGHLAWVRARQKAQAALGERFELGWFHDILSEGVMPLSMLEARVEERIRERLAAG